MRDTVDFLRKIRGWRAGFTLTELLVAIAVIGILASILIPTLARARMRARQTTCMGNLKQLGFAFLSYSHDYGKNVPYDANGSNSGWVELMKKEGITDQVLHCPMCDKNNMHSMGGMRKNWRVGTVSEAEGNVAEAVALAKEMDSGQNMAGLWARHPNYWRFVAGNKGRNKKATFQLHHVQPGCTEHNGKHNPHCKPQKPYCDPVTGRMITPPPCPPPDLSPKAQGGCTVVLVMCENVKPKGFALKIYDDETGQRISARKGTSVGDWELFEWSGPLSKSLGGEGSLLSRSKPFHKKAIGFDQAVAKGSKPLRQGKYYPDPPDGSGPVNYIFMRATICSSVDQKLTISVTGDDSYSVFMLRSDSGCSGGPATPCDKSSLATSGYGINAFVQSGHHHAEYEPEKFVEVPELLKSSIPLFVDANWAWVMPSPNDIPPATLDGGFGGIQRAILNRHNKHVNIVYGDGHAAPVKLPELYIQEWYPGCGMIPGMRPPRLPDN